MLTSADNDFEMHKAHSDEKLKWSVNSHAIAVKLLENIE